MYTQCNIVLDTVMVVAVVGLLVLEVLEVLVVREDLGVLEVR